MATWPTGGCCSPGLPWRANGHRRRAPTRGARHPARSGKPLALPHREVFRRSDCWYRAPLNCDSDVHSPRKLGALVDSSGTGDLWDDADRHDRGTGERVPRSRATAVIGSAISHTTPADPKPQGNQLVRRRPVAACRRGQGGGRAHRGDTSTPCTDHRASNGTTATTSPPSAPRWWSPRSAIPGPPPTCTKQAST
jgi:hypothetical protein